MKPIHFVLPIAICATLAAAQPADLGFQWMPVGSPGNAPALPSDEYFFLTAPAGRVDYEYALSKTEITCQQLLPFIKAYVTVHPEAINEPGLHGDLIYTRTHNAADPQWTIQPGAENAPPVLSWHFAARYCNWLQNGQATTAAAFESGAYDTSTFVRNPDGTWSGQATRSAGAQYWIPSLDEWVKGMYYDPNKNGQSNPGYWLYPYMSDSMLPGGLPGTPGVFTSAGEYEDGGIRHIFPAGSYPHAMSPWGLLDGSGGESEWIEAVTSDGTRWLKGSTSGTIFPYLSDRLDYDVGYPPHVAIGGLRIATIPAPWSAAGFLILLAFQPRSPRVATCSRSFREASSVNRSMAPPT